VALCFSLPCRSEVLLHAQRNYAVRGHANRMTRVPQVADLVRRQPAARFGGYDNLFFALCNEAENASKGDPGESGLCIQPEKR
jgi:hypothetical protein